MYRMGMDIYRNLNKGGWSLRNTDGLVVANPTIVLAFDVRWVVQPAGRERARREGVRNVHAFGRFDLYYDLTGLEDDIVPPSERDYTAEVTYNPFTCETFVLADTGECVTESDVVLFWHDERAYAWRTE